MQQQRSNSVISGGASALGGGGGGGGRIVGPRAKCDQVVYEAIAKAAEIIVRSRCQIPSRSSSAMGNDAAGGTRAIHLGSPYARKSKKYGGNALGSGGGGGGSSSRFNLEVEEVADVRAILQRWRRSLHVPLRLDIYYQHEAPPPTERDGEAAAPQRELLERWCIDYVASSSSTHDSGASSPSPTTPFSNEDTIAQLRQVCKKVVILLRTLHCLLRMMPAYRLHRLLLAESLSYEGGGTGSYGIQNGHGVYYARSDSGEVPSRSGGRKMGGVGFSIYVSEEENDVASLTTSPSSPFRRQGFNGVATPYGMLHLTALYDFSLNADRLLQDASRDARAGASMPIPMGRNDGREERRHGPSNERRQEGGHPHEREGSHGALPPSSLPTGGSGVGEVTMPKNHSYNHRQISGEFIIQNYADQPTSAVDGAAGIGADQGLRSQQRQGIQWAQSSVSEPSTVPGNDDASAGKRVLSGLSLALMNEEANGNEGPSQAGALNDGDDRSPPPSPVQRVRSIDDASLRKQRLALHHPPPFQTAISGGHHPVENAPFHPGGGGGAAQHSTSASPQHRPGVFPGRQTSAEYGYGYNNNVYNGPTAQHRIASAPIRISPNEPMTGDANAAVAGGGDPSPSPLTNTPPQPMFIGSTPPFTHSPHGPTTAAIAAGGGSSRNRSGTAKVSPGGGGDARFGESRAADGVNPPFRNNPTSLQEATDASFPSPMRQPPHRQQQPSRIGPNDLNNATPPPHRQPRENEARDALLLPPLESLDLLHMSPFKTAGCENGSLLSSLSVAGLGAAAASGADETPYGSAMGTAFLRGSAGGAAAAAALSSSIHHPTVLGGEPSTSFDEMPFAVDPVPPVGGGPLGIRDAGNVTASDAAPGATTGRAVGSNSRGGSSLGASASSSSVVASFAHRCATGGRLKLFGSERLSAGADDGASVDRRSGGASLSRQENGGGGEAVRQGVGGSTNDAELGDGAGGVREPKLAAATKPLQVSSLADQLAEFRSFGASLDMGNATAASSSHRSPATGGGSVVAEHTTARVSAQVS